MACKEYNHLLAKISSRNGEEMIFDTHAHYDDSAFDSDREELIDSLKDSDVVAFVNVGANLKGCEDSLLLSRRYPFVYSALGIHPSETGELNEDNFNGLKKIISDNSIKNNGKVVAVGEIGLDYYYDDTNPDLQKIWFERQLLMSKEVALPVIIHSRDACKDTMDLLQATDVHEGIIHCYSYSLEAAKQFVDMGFVIGIGGALTFKNAKKLPEVVEYIPLDMIVLETDCPYMTPVPHRGERNDSRYIKYVAQRIAQIKNVSYEQVLEATFENAKRVYGINADIR